MIPIWKGTLVTSGWVEVAAEIEERTDGKLMLWSCADSNSPPCQISPQAISGDSWLESLVSLAKWSREKSTDVRVRGGAMRVVYIAGPFRGANAWEVEQNIRRAEVLAFEVAKLGAMPLCPHTNTGGFDSQLAPEFMLAGTMELMRRCDAVLFTADWERSAGARGEYLEAQRLGMPCYLSLIELEAWLRTASLPAHAVEEDAIGPCHPRRADYDEWIKTAGYTPKGEP